MGHVGGTVRLQAMNPTYPLPERFGNAALRGMEELILGPSPSWWPAAPGWWVLAGIVFLLLLRAVLRHLRRWFKDRYRREGLRELRHLQHARANSVGAAACNELLKRVALATYPRPEVASLTGSAWVAWLESSAPNFRFSRDVRQALSFGPYQPYTPDPSLMTSTLFKEAAHWISKHRRGDDHELR